MESGIWDICKALLSPVVDSDDRVYYPLFNNPPKFIQELNTIPDDLDFCKYWPFISKFISINLKQNEMFIYHIIMLNIYRRDRRYFIRGM